MLLGAVATWGDRASSWIVLSALPARGESVVDVPEAQLDRLDRDGYIPWSKRVRDGIGKTKSMDTPLVGTTLEIVVARRP